MMNDTAVPWPETTRSTMPNATVHSHAPVPAGNSAPGRRQARQASQPIPSPARNGHEVEAIPETASPSAWLARPMITNIRTLHISSAAAAAGLG
jgi:hypothetical protein